MSLSDQIRTAIETFSRLYGKEPEVLGIAPGRVNLIGEHTDYNGGWVFPAAINQYIVVAAAECSENSELFSMKEGKLDEFDATAVSPLSVHSWGKYPAGVAWAIQRYLDQPAKNMQAVVASNLPTGSGVSSSAAIEMAFLVIQEHFLHIDLDPVVRAKLGQRCENDFIGLRSGIMDQLASALGRENCAIRIDTESLEYSYASIPPGVSIVLCDTKTPRSLAASAYNERRSECEAAATFFGKKLLREVTLEELATAEGKLDRTVFRRARHVITENQRCQDYFDALQARDLVKIGTLMKASHESLDSDYEVSSTALNQMAQAAWQSPGCIGARMTGAGFGGAVVALVESASADDFIASVGRSYEQSSGQAGDFYVLEAANGAKVMTV